MDSSTQGVTTSLAGYESSPSEDSSSLDSVGPEDLPGHMSELDGIANTTSVCVDSSIQQDSVVDPLEEQIVIHARAYQVEMFEESLKQNIIVAVRLSLPTTCYVAF
jgi:hypothetical protein